MFETSFLLFLKYLLLNIFVPFIPGLLFLWIFYGNKFRGILLYILSRFGGVGVVAFSLLNIQFIHFGIGIFEYFVILGLLLLVFLGKIYFKKQKINYYIQTLILKNIFQQVKGSFLSLSLIGKFFTMIISIYSIYFICITGLFDFNLPTYGMDSFWNRNDSAYNVYMDGGVKLFGNEDEILGGGRLGYPIQIPIYKVLISKFVGGMNDIYFNIWEWLVFLFGLLFVSSITFRKTKNIFLSILPVGLIISLPLIFFHSFEGYMDLPLIIYCVISAWLFYQYLESRDFDHLSLGLLFGFVVSNIKNDGFIVFFPGLLIALFMVLCLNKKLNFTIKGFFKDRSNLFKFVGYFIYFLLPFLIIRFLNGLGFNQAGYIKAGIGWSDKIHRETFSGFKQIFLEMDNYNLILVVILFLIMALLVRDKKSNNDILFLFAGLFMFLILIAVFLFTIDYMYFENQTTVNRVFTMCFIIVLAFSGFLFDEKQHL